jgi:hypothetical protein
MRPTEEGNFQAENPASCIRTITLLEEALPTELLNCFRVPIEAARAVLTPSSESRFFNGKAELRRIREHAIETPCYLRRMA